MSKKYDNFRKKKGIPCVQKMETLTLTLQDTILKLDKKYLKVKLVIRSFPYLLYVAVVEVFITPTWYIYKVRLSRCGVMFIV